MSQLVHETLAVAGSIVSPTTTRAAMEQTGCIYVLVSTTEAVRFTIDGATSPAVGAGAEVGTLMSSTDKFVFTIDEFLASKFLDVSTDARVQFEFLNQKFQ